MLGAVEGLGELNDSRAIAPLHRLLNNQRNPEISNTTAIALGKLGDHTVADRLIEIISKKNIVNEYPWLFREVVRALVDLHETSAAPILQSALEQIDPEYYEADEMDDYDSLVNTLRDAIGRLATE